MKSSVAKPKVIEIWVSFRLEPAREPAITAHKDDGFLSDFAERVRKRICGRLETDVLDNNALAPLGVDLSVTTGVRLHEAKS